MEDNKEYTKLLSNQNNQLLAQNKALIEHNTILKKELHELELYVSLHAKLNRYNSTAIICMGLALILYFIIEIVKQLV